MDKSGIEQPEGQFADLIVAVSDADQPLGTWLAFQLGGPVDELIARGAVWVDGRRVQDAGRPLAAGSIVVVRRPPNGGPADLVLGPECILYEDADLIAINKPAGAYVEATPWDALRHVRGALATFLTERDGITPQLHLAHRLDRDTTGVLLLTKNPAVNRVIQKIFVGRLVQKEYLAHCAGAPAFDSIIVETGHGRSRQGFFRVYELGEVGRELPGGSRVKLMRTRFELIRRLGDTALVHAWPETGRTHQIRLHLAYLGHALVGDQKYGGPVEWRGTPVDRHHLHARRLELPHPRGGNRLIIAAPDPLWAAAL